MQQRLAQSTTSVPRICEWIWQVKGYVPGPIGPVNEPFATVSIG